jgi:AraC-like DNA-binding protein
MADRLSSLLQRFELQAHVFHSGALCEPAEVDGREAVGHLHLLRQGVLVVTDADGQRLRIAQPSLLFYPRPMAHRLQAEGEAGADLLCATIRFGVGDENPLLRGLPARLLIPLADAPTLDAAQALLCSEAQAQRCGHAAVVDRLTEVLMVQMLRFAIEHRLVDAGLLAGLADPLLSKALNAMHADPARPWTLADLAQQAGMSRSRFAARFSLAVGLPPAEYLVQWRVGLAKGLLRRGRPVKQVAEDVGYGGASAFGRAFAQVVGMPPGRWVNGLSR